MCCVGGWIALGYLLCYNRFVYSSCNASIRASIAFFAATKALGPADEEYYAVLVFCFS